MSTKMICELKDRSQITIPSSLVKKLDLKTGDFFEIQEKDGALLLIPSITIPRDQAWFYKPTWQKEEQQVDRDLNDGKGLKAKSKKELFQILDLDEQ